MSFHLGKPILAMLAIALVSGAIILRQPARRSSQLTLWVFADQHYRVYGPLCAKFETQKPVSTVKLELIQGRAMQVRLQSIFTNDLHGENVPDLVEIEVGAIGKFFRPRVEDIGLVDLTDRLKESGLYDRVVEQRFAPWSKQGRIFGVPHDVHPCVISYREDLFREAGIDLSGPKTWGEFQQACLQFQSVWRARGYQQRHALELPVAKADCLVMMLLQRGINLVDARDMLWLSHPKVANTISFYARCVAGEGNIASESSSTEGAATKDLIYGNICALITPDWRITDIKHNSGTALEGKMRIRPLPIFDQGDAPTSTWGGTMMGILKNSPRQEEAWKLLRFLYFNEDSLNSAREISDIVPPIKSQWARPEYHQSDQFFAGQRSGELLVELAERIPRRYVTPYSNLASGSLAFVLSKAVNYVNRQGTEGLEAQCQKWLDEAQFDLRQRMVRLKFD